MGLPGHAQVAAHRAITLWTPGGRPDPASQPAAAVPGYAAPEQDNTATLLCHLLVCSWIPEGCEVAFHVHGNTPSSEAAALTSAGHPGGTCQLCLSQDPCTGEDVELPAGHSLRKQQGQTVAGFGQEQSDEMKLQAVCLTLSPPPQLAAILERELMVRPVQASKIAWGCMGSASSRLTCSAARSHCHSSCGECPPRAPRCCCCWMFGPLAACRRCGRCSRRHGSWPEPRPPPARPTHGGALRYPSAPPWGTMGYPSAPPPVGIARVIACMCPLKGVCLGVC